MNAPQPFDPRRRFVRVMQHRTDGLVEFEFAVGEPELYVELVMSHDAFTAFCDAQGVQATQGPLPERHDDDAQAREWDWNLRSAREQHFRHGP